MLFRLREPHFINGGWFDKPLTAGPAGSGADIVYDLPPTYHMEGADPEGIDAVNALWQAQGGTDAPWTLVEEPFDPYTGAPIVVPLPPTVVDIPNVSGVGTVGETLTCTMGNWTAEPTHYAYLWKRDGLVTVGTDSNTYVVGSGDVGFDVICIVTASNAAGTATAPPSNAVSITAAGTATAAEAPPPASRSSSSSSSRESSSSSSSSHSSSREKK